MPNGGPYCCANCSHNRAFQEMPHPIDAQWGRFVEVSHCMLRDVKIRDPMSTKCQNFIYGKRLDELDRNEKLMGWIFAVGLKNEKYSYPRIPWDGNNEPREAKAAECFLCKRRTSRGLCVINDGIKFEFCSNHHYVQWWRTIHNDSLISESEFKSPEEIYDE